MSICVVSKFHTNPFATHFVGHRSRCATTEETVKDKISRLGSKFQNFTNKCFWFGIVKWIIPKQGYTLVTSTFISTNIGQNGTQHLIPGHIHAMVKCPSIF